MVANQAYKSTERKKKVKKSKKSKRIGNPKDQCNVVSIKRGFTSVATNLIYHLEVFLDNSL